MKLLYVVAPAHSGSTLSDCILGSHPSFVSAGELRFLRWQLERSQLVQGSVADNSLCTCLRDWSDCEFWSEVFVALKDKTGVDISVDPSELDLNFFGSFSLADKGGYQRDFTDRLTGLIFKHWLIHGLPVSLIRWLDRSVQNQIENNWKLLDTMSEVAGREVVINSSKRLVEALLLQQYRPNDVWILFLNRDIRRIAASQKKMAIRRGQQFSVRTVLKQSTVYRRQVLQCMNSVPELNYIESTYEEIVSGPSDFLSKVVQQMSVDSDYKIQSNSSFWFDPANQHMVDGNAMRYRGKQAVKMDDRWRQTLDERELHEIENWTFS